MPEIELPAPPVLTDVERACLARYLRTLVETLGDDLDEVVLFGSVARGESWPAGMPIRSDLDLLVVTRDAVSDETAARLVDATLPLFLECGRQIGPQFRTRGELEQPRDDRAAAFRANVERDGLRLHRRSG